MDREGAAAWRHGQVGAEGGVGVPAAVEKLEGAPGFIHGRAALLGKGDAMAAGFHGRASVGADSNGEGGR